MSASATESSGRSVTGSTIMPDSLRFTLSTSATWSAIERLRCTTPRPPSRASAIASRASVTVSIAAETIGISSAIVRVRRVAVRTSFGSTDDSAGKRRTSSKVSPSRPNLSSYESSWPSKEHRVTAPLDGLGHGRELRDVDGAEEPAGLPGIEVAGADPERRRGAGGDGELQRLLRGPAGEVGGDELGEEDAAGADDGDGLDPGRRVRAVATHLPILPEERVAAALERDVHVTGAEFGDRVERHQEVLLVLELLADDVLGLTLVRRDEPRLRLGTETERLPLRVEHDLDTAPGEITHGLAVKGHVDAPGQRAGEDDEVGAAGEVVELLEQRLELVRGDLGAPLVDLGVRALRRVDDRGRGPRLLADPDEVVQDRLRRQFLDDAGAGAAAREARRDDRHVEPLQRPRHVDPLAARERQHLARAMALAELEVGHGQSAVERGVERDGDDHPTSPPRWSSVRPA